MRTITIRKGLSIEILTVPGSARIQWWISNPKSAVMFDPVDSTFRSCGESASVVDILLNLSPRDLGRIKRRLLKHAKERGKGFAVVRKRTAGTDGFNAYPARD